MKKQLLLLTMMLLPMVASVNVFAYDIAVENADGVTIYYNYINNGNELEVTYLNSSDYNYFAYAGNIVIPEEVTFMSRIQKVTSIGHAAFQNCSGLTSVTIPNSVMSIGANAFKDCLGLTSIEIPNSVTSIGDSAFSGCYHLTSATISNSVTSIGEWAFYNCSRLISLTIPNSVTSIGTGAFFCCYGLTSVNIPNSVISIGNDAFCDCISLTSVHISDIAAWCKISFGNMSSSPLYFAHHLFMNNEEIKDLIIPNSVTSIGKWSFSGCSGLTTITIPNSVTSIGWGAFSDCSGLTSVTIPNSVTSIGNSAFSGCSGLTSVTIHNNVTSISDWAFHNCSGLTSVTIPNSVTSIGNAAFSGCNISVVISQIELPFAITGKDFADRSFSMNTFNNATLYVPVGTIDKYKETEGWKDFVHIEEGVTDGVAQVPANAVLIQSNGGQLTIQGVGDGTQVSVYSINGTEAGKAISKNGCASISTNLQAGSVAIIKIGEKSVKVVVK